MGDFGWLVFNSGDTRPNHACLVTGESYLTDRLCARWSDDNSGSFPANNVAPTQWMRWTDDRVASRIDGSWPEKTKVDAVVASITAGAHLFCRTELPVCSIEEHIVSSADQGLRRTSFQSPRSR
jgi:hypothetical protein